LEKKEKIIEIMLVVKNKEEEEAKNREIIFIKNMPISNYFSI
jgi:hypothetical protein